MRIPREKIYRAFPELDPFPDAQCERLLKRALDDHGYQALSPWIVLASVLGTMSCCGTAWWLLNGFFWRLFAALHPSRQTEELAALLAVSVVPALAGLSARDWHLRRRMRRLIWHRIDRIRCPNCRHSLLGQSVIDARNVRCPECGHVTTLGILGLSRPEDLLPPGPDEDGMVRQIERNEQE